MMMIGVERNQNLIFEGDTKGREVYPPPHLTRAAIDHPQSPVRELSQSNRIDQLPMLLFREDSFDATTRIRRGRFYANNDHQPVGWIVQDRQGHWGQMHLDVFYHWRLTGLPRFERCLVMLGSRDFPTLWSVIWAEDIATGEQLVTLKARGSLGVLPEINDQAVPSGALAAIKEVTARVVDTAHRGSPHALVDRCRDAAQQLLAHWMASVNNDPSLRLHDLTKLASLVETPEAGKRVVLGSSARIIARLHARAKPNEQERYGIEDVTEAEAECAVSLLGLMVRELGWARP